MVYTSNLVENSFILTKGQISCECILQYFVCKNWLTTDLSIDFMRAYEIYAMRWSIEVFFSDAKRLLDLAGCSARDFSSQIAHVSMVVIRYNILALIKR